MVSFLTAICTVFILIMLFWLHGWGGNRRWGQPSLPAVPIAFLSPLCRKQHPYSQEQRGLGRNDVFFWHVYVFWGGLVCSFFGKRWTTVPRASASCLKQHQQQEGIRATLSLYPTGGDGLQCPACVSLCICALYSCTDATKNASPPTLPFLV